MANPPSREEFVARLRALEDKLPDRRLVPRREEAYRPDHEPHYDADAMIAAARLAALQARLSAMGDP